MNCLAILQVLTARHVPHSLCVSRLILLLLCLQTVWSRDINVYSICAFLPVEFDDCAGNKDVAFDVSHPSFHVDGDLNLVSHQDILYRGPVLFIHGVSAHADDLAQVEFSGLPVGSPHTLRVSND